jgi:hypothetical protein
MRCLTLVLLLALACSLVFGDTDKRGPLPPQEARKHLNEECTVELTVKASKDSPSRQTYFLDSEEDFRKKTNLAVLIAYAAKDKFQKAGIDNPATYYRGKRIRVTGKPIAEDGQVRIKVQDPGQIKIVEKADAPPPGALLVGKLSGKSFMLTAGEIGRLPRQQVQVKEADHTVRYDGIALATILRKADVLQDNHLRGAALATYVLVEASDGFRVVFSLAELDPWLTDHVILLADRKNGQPLAAAEGPYRLIVPHEKRHSRWVKQVNRITLHRAQ